MKNRIKKSLKASNGITLIALVITIIVLLILAGISISMLAGDNSILQRAAQSKERTERAEIIETAQMDVLSAITENKGNNLSESQFITILKKYFKNNEIPESLPSDLSKLELATLNEKYKIKVSEIYTGNLATDIVNGSSSDWQLNEAKDTIIAYIGDGFDGDTVIIPNQVDGNQILNVGSGETPPSSIFKDTSSLIANKNLKISKGIVNINNYAFYNCSSFIGDLSLPNGINNIGQSAFYNCFGFTALHLPNSVTKIKTCAFQNCSGFTGELKLSDNLTDIGTASFQGCTALTGNLIIPDSVKLIDAAAFLNCSELNGNLTIPNSVTTIGYNAFGGTGFSGTLTIGISEITNSLMSNSFSGTSFTKLVLTSNVKKIWFQAFQNCTSLTGSLIIPSSVTDIYNQAFKNCTGLTSITIKNSEENISVTTDAFDGTVTPEYEN